MADPGEITSPSEDGSNHTEGDEGGEIPTMPIEEMVNCRRIKEAIKKNAHGYSRRQKKNYRITADAVRL